MSILLTHAYVVTVDTARRVIPDGWILIEGNLITGIGSCASDPMPSASEVLDMKGMLAMPGLVNGHNHHWGSLFKNTGEGLLLEDWLDQVTIPLLMTLTNEDLRIAAYLGAIEQIKTGTTCSLNWRVAGERERLWVCNPGHPIARGIDGCFELAQEEMYGEPFAVPAPDEQVFISWFAGGEVFRSGCCWRRGNGKIFYFRPGHEIYPTYFDRNVRRVLANAAEWARPEGRWVDACVNVKIPRESLG
jgi:hypothetical protein